MDSVDLPVMDVECNLGDLLLPGIKALQIPFVVPHIPALTHTHTHTQLCPAQAQLLPKAVVGVWQLNLLLLRLPF